MKHRKFKWADLRQRNIRKRKKKSGNKKGRVCRKKWLEEYRRKDVEAKERRVGGLKVKEYWKGDERVLGKRVDGREESR